MTWISVNCSSSLFALIANGLKLRQSPSLSKVKLRNGSFCKSKRRLYIAGFSLVFVISGYAGGKPPLLVKELEWKITTSLELFSWNLSLNRLRKCLRTLLLSKKALHIKYFLRQIYRNLRPSWLSTKKFIFLSFPLWSAIVAQGFP